MTAFGLTGIGTAPAAFYFGIDAYYSGGVKGYMNDSSDQILYEYHNNEGIGSNSPWLLF